jgi:hypothetical protein
LAFVNGQIQTANGQPMTMQQVIDAKNYGDQLKQQQAMGGYVDAANAQGQSSQQVTGQQTQANRPDQNTPFAQSQWHQNPDGTWSQTTGYTGPLGAAATGLQNQIAQNFSQPLDNGAAAGQQAFKASYNQSLSRLDPQFNQSQEQLQTQLANQGLAPGSQAYRQAMDNFGRSRNDAYQSALNNATLTGAQLQNQTFAQNMAARNMPMQELQGLGGFLAMPGFTNAQAADPTQYLAAYTGVNNYNLANAQMQNQATGQFLGGLGDFAGMGLGGYLARKP